MSALVAYGAISARGRGEAAVAVAALGSRETTLVARDEGLAAAGLRKPLCARAVLEASVDRATALLDAALVDCMKMLDAGRPDWRRLRVGLALGTSSGGMASFSSFMGSPLDGVVAPSALDATYAGPVAAVVARHGQSFAPASVVLAACASSTIALGLGRAWLEDDRCDLVLAGGFDCVSVFVAAGFEALRATCGERGPRPFRRDRDGLALGEGAAVVALAREAWPGTRAWLSGFATTCDAHHLTGPDPEGAGLARAAERAVASAGGPTIGLVGAHGTATMQNDAAEAKTLARVGQGAPAFSYKGTIGHALGAAGVLETLAAVDALTRGLAPATCGEGEVEEGARVADRAAPSAARTALKLSSAFGGANAALVLALDAPARRAAQDPRRVFVSRAVRVHNTALAPQRLAQRTGYPLDRITRADDLVRRTLAAVASLVEVHGSLRGAGIVVGLGLATVETNARFLARLPRPEPRRFPYTTPNAGAGECAVAFGLDGPAFAVGGGPHGGLEAIAIAADLVRAGLADRIVVVAADEAGPASSRIAPGTGSGAVGVLVQNTAIPHGAELTAWGVSFVPPAIKRHDLPPMDAHSALLPLVDGAPKEMAAAVPWGGEAKLTLRW